MEDQVTRLKSVCAKSAHCTLFVVQGSGRTRRSPTSPGIPELHHAESAAAWRSEDDTLTQEDSANAVFNSPQRRGARLFSLSADPRESLAASASIR